MGKIKKALVMTADIEYEILTKSIYEALLRQDGVTIDVHHNVILKGAAAEHQIDVYWEYKIADTLFRVAIECKNYNSKVTIGKVRDFYGVLTDIGNIQGIMVSKQGFQKGAKEYAQHYGINLKEIRKPHDEDWSGRIKTIVVHMKMIIPHIKKWKINIDNEWMKNNYTIPQGTMITLSLDDTTDNIWLIDSCGNKISNFYYLEQKLPTDMKAAKDVVHTYKFEDAFLENADGVRFKVSSVEYLYDVIETLDSDIIIDGTHTAKAIIKDALNGSIKFINNDGLIK